MLIFEQEQDEKLSLLQKAIDSKVEISFWYQGKEFKDPKNKKAFRQGWRYVQPTDLGRNKYTGNWILRAWQVGGTTNSERPEWKTFLVSEMRHVTLMTGDNSAYKPFQSPSGYDFNLYGDKSMEDDTPEFKIDLRKSPIPDQSIVNKEKDEISESSGFLKWVLNF